MNVSNNPCISQVEECVIYNGAVNCGGVEEGQLCIAWSIPIEVGVGEGTSVQWGAIGGGMFRPLALKYDSISHWGIFDKSSDFLFPILVDEDEGVVFGISGVVLVPSFSRMHQFFFFVAD